MQAQHILIGVSAAWLLTLALLPYLISRTNKRAQVIGYSQGMATRDKERTKQEGRLVRELTRRRTIIEELEERIGSYTGLAVTRRDHQLLISAIETLAMAHSTWLPVAGTEPWRLRAKQQASDLTVLATRIAAELKNVPATALAQPDNAQMGEVA